MLGLKWRSKDKKNASRCTPVFIEMKYGISAYDGGSGIAKHLADLDAILGDPTKKAALDLTIAGQFNQLDELGLLRFWSCSGGVLTFAADHPDALRLDGKLGRLI